MHIILFPMWFITDFAAGEGVEPSTSVGEGGEGEEANVGAGAAAHEGVNAAKGGKATGRKAKRARRREAVYNESDGDDSGESTDEDDVDGDSEPSLFSVGTHSFKVSD